jgi:hypothetical protein
VLELVSGCASIPSLCEEMSKWYCLYELRKQPHLDSTKVPRRTALLVSVVVTDEAAMNHDVTETILLAATMTTDGLRLCEVETETSEVETTIVLPDVTMATTELLDAMTIEGLLDATLTEETMNHDGRDVTTTETDPPEGKRRLFQVLDQCLLVQLSLCWK